MNKLRQFVFDARIALANLMLAVPSHAVRRGAITGIARAELGADVSLGRSIRVTTLGGLQIGSRSIVNRGVLLDGRGGLRVGADVNISPEVRLWTAEHDPASPGFAGRELPVSVAGRSWLASEATILPGAAIGEGAVVAARAVVRGSVAPWTIVAGNPSRPIGVRSQEAQQKLSPYRPFLR